MSNLIAISCISWLLVIFALTMFGYYLVCIRFQSLSSFYLRDKIFEKNLKLSYVCLYFKM